MAKARIELARRADIDLDETATYLEGEAGKRRSKAALRKLWKRIDTLAEHPRAGVARDPLGRGRRLLMARPYCVVYQIENEAAAEVVLILRVLHGARDIEAILAQD